MLRLTEDKLRVFTDPQGPKQERRAGCWWCTATVARCLGVALLAALLAACPPEARTVGQQDLEDHLKKGKVGRAFNLVDLRPEEAYAGRHLPGAINVPYERLAADRLLFLDGLPVIFYDEAEPDLARLRDVVGARLPSHVVVLEGGFRGWVAAGLPVTTGT